MFTTTAVVLTIGIARWVEGRTQDVKLVAFSGAILVIVGVGLLMDRLPTPSECRQQVALCRTRADAATDERLRAVWTSMALIWTKLAAHKERLQRLNAQGA
jgi:hypothetical protein